MRKVVVLCYVFMGLLIIACNISWAAAPVLKESFPRLMGMNIGAKNYHDKRYQEEMSRLDIVILGFYPGWGPQPGASVQDVVLAIKQRNPHILVGQYTVLDEAYDNLDINIADKDKYFKLKKEAWWLRNSAGRKLQWTDENNAWMINITEWAKPDGEGRRYPEWLADRDYRMYFAPVPEFDIWYFDNINYGPRVVADWDLDGRDDDKSNPVIEAAYRRGHRAQWDSVRRLAPTRLLLGNTDNDLSYPEFVQALNGAFLEGIMGLKWSIETWGGWYKAMDRYWAAVKNTALPHLVGFNVWGDPEDYRFFRYAYASCLMGDGYFSFTDKNKVYSSVPWFDEYSIDLGNAIDPPQKVAGQNGIYKRAFKNGMAIVNPTTRAAEVDFSEPLYLLAGIQDKHVNNGKRVLKLTIDPKDGLILSRYPVVPRIYKSSAEDMRRLIH